MYLIKYTLYLVIGVTVFWSSVLSVIVDENGLADFSDEDEDAEQINEESKGIRAVKTTSLEHFTALRDFQLPNNQLTEFPDLTPISNTLKWLRLRSNNFLTTAHNVRLAVLNRLERIDIKFTHLSLLTSTCPIDSTKQYWFVADTLDLCDCQHVWLKVSFSTTEFLYN